MSRMNELTYLVFGASYCVSIVFPKPSNLASNLVQSCLPLLGRARNPVSHLRRISWPHLGVFWCWVSSCHASPFVHHSEGRPHINAFVIRWVLNFVGNDKVLTYWFSDAYAVSVHELRADIVAYNHHCVKCLIFNITSKNEKLEINMAFPTND